MSEPSEIVGNACEKASLFINEINEEKKRRHNATTPQNLTACQCPAQLARSMVCCSSHPIAMSHPRHYHRCPGILSSPPPRHPVIWRMTKEGSLPGNKRTRRRGWFSDALAPWPLLLPSRVVHSSVLDVLPTLWYKWRRFRFWRSWE